MACRLSSVSEKSDESCTLAGTNKMLGQKLGCGEQGCAYKLTNDNVIKISSFSKQLTKPKWLKEACIGKDLGKFGIGPVVKQFFECNGKGYIVMETLQDATIWGDKGRVVHIRTKTGENSIDHVERIPLSVQGGFIKLFREMTRRGYIHMDNHIANIGYVKNAGVLSRNLQTACNVETVKDAVLTGNPTCVKPILFDFGFVQERKFSKVDAQYAVAFSCFQVIEHCPRDTVASTAFYKVAMACCSTQVFSTLKDIEFEVRTRLKSGLTDENADLAVGCLCYVAYMHDRNYDSPLYDVIYKIRMGKYRFK
jgi:hypothetical protein